MAKNQNQTPTPIQSNPSPNTRPLPLFIYLHGRGVVVVGSNVGRISNFGFFQQVADVAEVGAVGRIELQTPLYDLVVVHRRAGLGAES